MTTPTRNPVIRIEGLSKRYGSTLALDGLDLELPAGTVFGYLGPNGAGKTTTIRLLMGLIRPTSGTAAVLGHDVVRQRAAQLIEGLRPLRVLSPFYQAIAEGPLGPGLPPIAAVMLLVGLAALAVAVPVFDRRDLAA